MNDGLLISVIAVKIFYATLFEHSCQQVLIMNPLAILISCQSAVEITRYPFLQHTPHSASPATANVPHILSSLTQTPYNPTTPPPTPHPPHPSPLTPRP